MTAGRPIVTTHRLQLEPRFTFDDAAAQVDHLAALGFTHLYLSPVLQASTGSPHGYDVVDHARVADDLGGEEGWQRLVSAARAAGLGLVVDIVPNHMTTPTPLWDNVPFWSVLRDGPSSPYAAWFDIDWAAQDGKLLMPVLGGTLEEALAAGELTIDRAQGEDVVRYYDHVLPVAPGTTQEGMPLSSLLGAQHYRLASWRTGTAELNYRRFFDVTSLVAVRVEDPEVFDATHERVVAMVRAGEVDGLRIDHPDGLADPEGYLQRLAAATDGTWVVVEKILEGEERLPQHWRCAGTTGYDALLRVGGLFVDPAGAAPLAALADDLLGETQDLDAMVVTAKRYVVDQVLVAEVERLTRLVARALPDLPVDVARRALEALLVAMDRYRIYVRPGERDAFAAVELAHVAAHARAADPSLDPGVLDQLVELALDRPVGVDDDARRDFCVRFQQTCGPVMAKGIEDTTFYRYVRLTGLNEVGGDPGRVGVEVADFHDYAQELATTRPTSMTTLSTHDTKRSEDVRARLAVLGERPNQWADWVRRARELAAPHRAAPLDPLTEYLLWQTLVGAWPIDAERLGAYATKAVREAKLHTTWTEPDEAYETAVARFVDGITGAADVAAHVEAWHEATRHETRAVVLGQKLVQLTMPGVPDLYQGTDLVDLSLVDPDNRRPVDYADRRTRLARLDACEAPRNLADAKLLVTATAARLRRERPDAFVGAGASYVPLETDTEHLVAFSRGGSQDDFATVTLATRLAGHLRDAGGWGASTVVLPDGSWRDALSGNETQGGVVPVADLLPEDEAALPVALLVRTDASDPTSSGGSTS